MKTSVRGLALIKQFEGFSPTAYLCPAGKATIGYGHVIQDGEYFAKPLSEQEAEKLLAQDISKAERNINRLVTSALNQNQFDALASFIYNVGAKAFEKSTLLKKIQEDEPEAAAQEFSRWVFSQGKSLKGLKNRRDAEQRLFIQPIE
ncbi:MAG: lysozyme [Rickettsiales bacterium]|nr:lysozyme [Rickettsiales bacterium]